ncbi:hypothetical protein C5167_016615 [Papaver somniferum]|uniref:uncharacterized protein LOC113345393 n=1 Tax=Papaver somniferum TaxID=3469 RepID=UPI000E6F5389|nr:uncharacterized protein LOC113345393 [Papaver somniferum]RZC93922.1 hypothetical protein C5167_016615 [Papaver somniferum]
MDCDLLEKRDQDIPPFSDRVYRPALLLSHGVIVIFSIMVILCLGYDLIDYSLKCSYEILPQLQEFLRFIWRVHCFPDMKNSVKFSSSCGHQNKSKICSRAADYASPIQTPPYVSGSYGYSYGSFKFFLPMVSVTEILLPKIRCMVRCESDLQFVLVVYAIMYPSDKTC